MSGGAAVRWCWWPCIACVVRVAWQRPEPTGSARQVGRMLLVLAMTVAACVRVFVDVWRSGANRCGFDYSPGTWAGTPTGDA